MFAVGGESQIEIFKIQYICSILTKLGKFGNWLKNYVIVPEITNNSLGSPLLPNIILIKKEKKVHFNKQSLTKSRSEGSKYCK